MKTIVPDYYSEFSCIQGKCRHSCCIGWEIDIDEDSLEYFHSLSGPMGKRLQENIDESGETPCFRLADDERCPFLNREGLCDLILELGEDSLCDICADHPRFRSFFSDREEIGLGLCCEEAARIILTWPAPVNVKTWEDDGLCEENTEDENYVLHLREDLISIVQDRSIPMHARIERMLDEAGMDLPPLDTASWSPFLQGLERLDEAWTAKLEDLLKPQRKAVSAPFSGLETAFEQLMVYLLWRHLPGALVDDDISGRIAFCARMWQLLVKMQRGDSIEDFVELCRMFSSEIEYSDENINAILEYIHNENPML